MILPHTSLCHEDAPNGELPSDPHRQTGTRRSPKLCKKPVSPFIVAPRAQASRRCETRAPLNGKAAKLCYRFGPLTPSARSANLIAGDGTKNGLSRSEQKTVSTTQNNRLTGKAPYRFESCSLQRGVRLCSELGGCRRKTLRFCAILHRKRDERGGRPG